MAKHSFTAQEADSGARLDAFLARCLGLGVRAAKRLIEGGSVTVAGKLRPPHYKLLPGSIVSMDSTPKGSVTSPLDREVRLVALSGDYAAFFKPSGLHTATITGSSAPSLEGIIHNAWDTLRHGKASSALPILLSRLDHETSGLVAAALSAEAALRFRNMETGGSVTKLYTAVIQGVLEEPLCLRGILDTANRKKTRVRPELSPDSVRHTFITPLQAELTQPHPDGPFTIVTARIHKGARHQIRAHLANAGFPLFGDRVYGDLADMHPLRLHHARLEFPDFSVSCGAPWIQSMENHIGPCLEGG